MRPREVPVVKPSSEQEYIPKSLLRSADRDAPKQWIPNERIPGTSKHIHSILRHNKCPSTMTQSPHWVTEDHVERLHSIEDEVMYLETEVDDFIREFYIAAAMFTTQADAQKRQLSHLLQRQKPAGTLEEE